MFSPAKYVQKERHSGAPNQETKLAKDSKLKVNHDGWSVAKMAEEDRIMRERGVDGERK